MDRRLDSEVLERFQQVISTVQPIQPFLKEESRVIVIHSHDHTCLIAAVDNYGSIALPGEKVGQVGQGDFTSVARCAVFAVFGLKCTRGRLRGMRNTVIAAVLAAFSSACVPTATNLPPLARQGVQAAQAGWREAGLPVPPTGRGNCAFEGVQLRWAPDMATFANGVGAGGEGCGSASAACLQFDESNHFFAPYRYPVIYLRPGFVLLPDSEPVIHEMMHAQWNCAGDAMHPQWTDPANIAHQDPRVWEAIGGATSAQGRARAKMSP